MSEEKTPVNPENEFVDDPSRRNFLAALIGGATLAYGAALSFVGYKYLSTGIENPDANLPAEVKIEGAEKLTNNSSMPFKFGSKPGILIKDEGGELHAYSSVCTHLGCTVSYQGDEKRIFCACHGGVYDPLSGKNISGPPPEPLPNFKIIKKGQEVFVSKA